MWWAGSAESVHNIKRPEIQMVPCQFNMEASINRLWIVNIWNVILVLFVIFYVIFVSFIPSFGEVIVEEETNSCWFNIFFPQESSDVPVTQLYRSISCTLNLWGWNYLGPAHGVQYRQISFCNRVHGYHTNFNKGNSWSLYYRNPKFLKRWIESLVLNP